MYNVFVTTTRLFEFGASRAVVERGLIADELLESDAAGAGIIERLGATDGVI